MQVRMKIKSLLKSQKFHALDMFKLKKNSKLNPSSFNSQESSLKSYSIRFDRLRVTSNGGIGRPLGKEGRRSGRSTGDTCGLYTLILCLDAFRWILGVERKLGKDCYSPFKVDPKGVVIHLAPPCEHINHCIRLMLKQAQTNGVSPHRPRQEKT